METGQSLIFLPQGISVAGVEWEYIVCGQGEQALLLLPGAHGLGEVAFQLIMRFEHA